MHLYNLQFSLSLHFNSNDDLGIITMWCYTTSKLPRLYPKPRFTIPIYKPITFRCSSVSRFRDRNWGLKVSAPEKIQFVDEDDSEVNNGFNPGAPPPLHWLILELLYPNIVGLRTHGGQWLMLSGKKLEKGESDGGGEDGEEDEEEETMVGVRSGNGGWWLWVVCGGGR
ncbi:hypothetical protein QVD17_30220 [Tagetes erecta]|uniref:Fatty acid desaturase N-terminal domain-containing protein n=1 Tax=Tagetes erecta TaxID=13708 RepID=A0AAD8K7J7_TARER|nr:hypothetical protein QVD17_30220 [Tagetes erecta]